MLLNEVGGGGGGLPSEYQQVEWIYNGSNTGYIDTGLIIPEVYPTKLKAGFVENDWNNYGAIVCSSGVTSGNQRNAGFDVHGEVKARRGTIYNSIYGSGSGAPLGQYVEAEAIYTEDTITVKARFPNDTFERTHQASESAFGYKLLVYFDATNANMVGRIYYLSVEQQGRITIDLIPCYRKQDGEIGMYDLVSQSFFAATRGTFTKGADV